MGKEENKGAKKKEEEVSESHEAHVSKTSQYSAGSASEPSEQTAARIEKLTLADVVNQPNPFLDNENAIRGELEALDFSTKKDAGAADDEDDLDSEIDMDPYDEASAGCTAVVCLVKNDTLYLANAGDSRAVLCRKGEAIALTTDHKPEMDTEKTRIYKAQGYIENGRVNGNLNLTRAIGDLMYKKNPNLTPEEQVITSNPDTFSYQLQDEDEFLIMGCDGIWEVKSNQDIVDFVRERLQDPEKRKNLGGICGEFMDSILSPDIAQTEGMGCDNMTMILTLFDQEKRKAWLEKAAGKEG